MPKNTRMNPEKKKYELEGLENDFERKFAPRLRAAAEGKDSLLFCVSELNRFREVRPPSENDDLFNAPKRIEPLKNELVLSDQQCSLAARYIDSCEEYNDIKNEHRRGSKKLADAILKLTADQKA